MRVSTVAVTASMATRARDANFVMSQGILSTLTSKVLVVVIAGTLQ